MSIVVDASVVVSALTTTGPIGRWAEDQLVSSGDLLAPELIHTEVTNVLRRAELAGQLDSTTAALAFDELQRLSIRVIAFPAIADRIWQLRNNLTAYDAAYVACAEAFDIPLATLDTKLINAPGPTCVFHQPTSQ